MSKTVCHYKILRFNLAILLLIFFGNILARPEIKSGDQIGLTIIGTIVGNKRSKGNVALIKESSSGKVKAVKVGFSILGGYTIKQINDKYLLLQKPGQNEVMVYRDQFKPDASQSPPPVVARQPQQPGGFVSYMESYSEDGFERNKENVRLTSGYRDNLLNRELAKVLMQATAIPNMVNNQINGWQLLQIDPGSIYDKAGIRNGDVITSINGQSLGDAASAIKILNRNRQTEKIEISVTRNGQPTQMFIEVQ